MSIMLLVIRIRICYCTYNFILFYDNDYRVSCEIMHSVCGKHFLLLDDIKIKIKLQFCVHNVAYSKIYPIHESVHVAKHNIVIVLFSIIVIALLVLIYVTSRKYNTIA